MSNIDVWPEEWVESEGQITVGAAIEQPGEPRRRLWYRLPADLRPAITCSANPFVAGVLFTTMRTGGRLTVHGDVSPSLLRNVDEFQSAWVAWRPKVYHRVEIVADSGCEAPVVESNMAVMMFSGGVDSSFTAWRHSKGRAGRQQCDLHAGVIVHGFDIALSKQAEFDGAAERARRMLASIGMELIPMVTNFRQYNGEWEDTHGAGLASCLMLLQGRYRIGLIASGYAYSYLSFPYGSNPMTDGMFSSDTFRIIHDGAGFNRLEKTREVVQWPEVSKYLRVCWQGEKLDRNCCRCQKCVSNMFYFRIFGLTHMECFPQDISNLGIIRMLYPDIAMIKSMQRILVIARDMHITDSWVTALKVSVLLNRLIELPVRPFRPLLRRLKRGIRRWTQKRGAQP